MKQAKHISKFLIWLVLLAQLSTSIGAIAEPSVGTGIWDQFSTSLLPILTGGAETSEEASDVASSETGGDLTDTADPGSVDSAASATDDTTYADSIIESVARAQNFSVDAKAALLIDLDSQTVLYEQNADERVYPASLTKIMTCMLVLEHGNLGDTVTVSQTALENLDAEGSTANLQVGEELTVEELLYCMMLSSANEACNVAAEYIAGSVQAFVDMMNEKAAQLGCTGTHFANTHGLHDDDHYTTARDLSIITQEALKSETFKTITNTTAYTVPATNLSAERKLTTTNYLISKEDTTNYYYPNASGVKTGYTSKAGRCLITTADDGNLHLLSILCGAETAVLDSGDVVLENFIETANLLDYGFDNFAYATLLSTLYPVAEMEVTMSAGAEAVVLSPSQEVSSLLPKDYDETLVETKVTLQGNGSVEAPVAKGQELGTITVYYDGVKVGTSPLAAITDIARSELSYQAATTKSFLTANWWKLILGLLAFLILVYVLVFVLAHIRSKKMRRKKRNQMQNRRRDEGR